MCARNLDMFGLQVDTMREYDNAAYLAAHRLKWEETEIELSPR